MNPAKILAAAATITAALGLNSGTAAAAPGTCVVTFQPQNEYSYHAAYQAADGTVTVLIAQQTEAIHLPPTSFDIPADALRVLWATRPELAPADPSNPANYFPKTLKDNGSSLWLGPDCTFTTPYTSAPNWRPSVVIRPGTPVTTTTQPTPTTTTSTTAVEPTTTTSTTVDLPPATTRPAPTTTHATTPEPPSSTTSEVTTTTTEIVVDVPLVERPTTTTAPTPEVPSSSTAVVVDLYTATSVERQAGTLPVTGANLRQALTLAACLVALGAVLAAAFRPVRRRYAEVTK